MDPQVRGQWRRYPFAVAGPWAVCVYTTMFVSGLIDVALGSRTHGLLALGVSSLAWTVTQVARWRFAHRRGLKVPSMVFSAGLWEVCAVLAAIVPLIVFRLDKGWLFVIYGVAGLVQETYRRSRWRARGYPGDPRWAVEWQPTGTNP